MYKVQSVKIDGFWHRLDAKCDFNDSVNIIIGKNGSGKTTFMNILSAVLEVNIDSLAMTDFDAAEITLTADKKTRNVKVRKYEDAVYGFSMLEYQISNKKYKMRLLPYKVESRIPPSQRKRYQEDTREIKSVLSGLVSLSSISVYRLRNDDDFEIRDRYGSVIVSPVDYRLNEVLKSLTTYRLGLSQKAIEISTKLQKDVLTSTLYSESDSKVSAWSIDFDKDAEEEALRNAYSQLNAYDHDVIRKIRAHVNGIDLAFSRITKQELEQRELDYVALEANRKTKRIVQLSLEAEAKTKEVYSQIDLFIEILNTFISDKKFGFKDGGLSVSNKQGEIEKNRLSSGEKQLLIILIESVLQNQMPHIFLADEPELSLHIQWQRMIIPAVKKLNPNAQVIVATHSPEIAAYHKQSIIDMEHIIHG